MALGDAINLLLHRAGVGIDVEGDDARILRRGGHQGGALCLFIPDIISTILSPKCRGAAGKPTHSRGAIASESCNGIRKNIASGMISSDLAGGGGRFRHDHRGA
jgi:hypothetical protein